MSVKANFEFVDDPTTPTVSHHQEMARSPSAFSWALYSQRNVRSDVQTKPARGAMKGESGRHSAFDDLALLTSRIHITLSKSIASKLIKLWELSAWLAGMPEQPRVQPDRDAIIVVNAGEGIGLDLTLRFAEAGYTVFGLVHRDRTTDEHGSAGELAYIWKRRQAKIKAFRETEFWFNDTHPAPGEVVPILYAPFSPTSTEMAKRTILAYCGAHGIRLHALILTPVFPSPAVIQEYLNNCPPHSPPPSPSLKRRRSDYTQEVKPEWEKPLFVSPDDTVSSASLHKHPPSSKHADYEPGPYNPAPQEGSYVPISIAHPDVVRRALERESTEQLITAQSFSDLLVPGAHHIDGNSAYMAQMQRLEAARLRRQREPPFYDMPDFKDGEGVLPSESPYSSDIHPLIVAAYEWFPGTLVLRFFQFVLTALVRLLFLRWRSSYFSGLESRRQDSQRIGRVVWLIGCSESSFGEVRSISAPMDDARLKMGTIMANEMRSLGVSVSVVKAGVLHYRACGLADLSQPNPAWDPRTNLSPGDISQRAAHYHSSRRRVRFLARISALWAIDEESCFWIVQKVVESRFPKRTYHLGMDVLVRRATDIIPSSLWDFGSWFVYHRMGGHFCEGILLDADLKALWRSALGPLDGWVRRWLATKADEIRRGQP